MTRDLGELATRLDEVVRSVPGVLGLFSADAALVRATRELTSTATPAMMKVTAGDDGLLIVASVGVSADRQAPLTARAVSAAIRTELGAEPIADLTVRISRVSEG